jgi:glucose-1-phosphate cytidylyltransferase
MKVVLFCGGLGMRLREYSESIPKPMVHIGCRPILWHVMKYYAHFGHKDFILCLGWKADLIKNYFVNYDEYLSNDFVLTQGGKVDLAHSDIHDWRITFVDTGINANIGQRLMAVRKHLEGEKVFLANYADGLTDLELPRLVEFFHVQKAIAAFLSVRPRQSFHAVDFDDQGLVSKISNISDSGIWMNGGYFVFSSQVFDYVREGEELVLEPFRRLIACRRLHTLKHEGFWACMDTYKEKQFLDDSYTRGDTPWELWGRGAANAPVSDGDAAAGWRQARAPAGAKGVPLHPPLTAPNHRRLPR